MASYGAEIWWLRYTLHACQVQPNGSSSKLGAIYCREGHLNIVLPPWTSLLYHHFFGTEIPDIYLPYPNRFVTSWVGVSVCWGKLHQKSRRVRKSEACTHTLFLLCKCNLLPLSKRSRCLGKVLRLTLHESKDQSVVWFWELPGQAIRSYGPSEAKYGQMAVSGCYDQLSGLEYLN